MLTGRPNHSLCSRMLCVMVTCLSASTLRAVAAPASQPVTSAPNWPAAWLEAWSNPPAELRPMQIVHSVPPARATPDAMATIRSAGLGGIVCNVNFADYLSSEANWATLVRAVDACRQTGLVAWIYDEEGYPSGAAGGLVLKANPAFEALVLTYDPSRNDPFALRRAYEFTHASNNFHAARRYPNLLDDAADRAFIDKTHQAYSRHLGPHVGTTIRAFFTDEPSLMAVHLGDLGEAVRKTVRVDDPIDEKLKPLPAVPWCDDLPARYRQRYGDDIIPLRRSLFAGTTDADRLVRRRFWALVADLLAGRYFGRIQDWCHEHHVASSGHVLSEENLLHHVPLYGNSLKMLGRMDIPGLDMLSSDPMVVVYIGWLTASLPASAATFNGGRRVMTEVSDFNELMAKKPPVSLAQMQAAAAWQAALGVTEFTSYYGVLARAAAGVSAGASDRTICREYCDYVGRLNALLRDARLNPGVVLYYPVHDLWSEYLPTAGLLPLESQSPRAQRIVRSFTELGQRLLTAQVSFALADHELLSTAESRDGGLWIKGRRFGAIALPAAVELPEPAAGIVARFRAAGGRVMRDGDAAAPMDANHLATIEPSGHIRPACRSIVVGRFVRDGREILLVVNVSNQPYAGRIHLSRDSRWSAADPATGNVNSVSRDHDGSAALTLPAHAAVLLIG